MVCIWKPLIALIVLGAHGLARSQGPDVPEPGGPLQVSAFVPDQGGNGGFAVSSGSAEVFAAEAERNGIRVDDAEVERWKAICAKLYPGKSVPGDAKKLLLAEKYLEARRLTPGDGKSDSAFMVKWNDSLFASSEEASQARKMNRFQEAFNGREVRKVGDKLRDVAQIHMFADRVDAPMWDLEAIQINGDPSDCLAWSSEDCSVNTGEFNAAALEYRVPLSLSLDSARVEILRRYLPVKRIADSALALGLDQAADSLMRKAEYKQKAARWIHASLRFGNPVSDQAALQTLYGRYYDRYFAASEELTLSIIGSSDSLYLDSLYRVHSAWSGRTKKGARPQSAPEPVLPWSHFKSSELPGEFEDALGKFRIGQCTPPFRTGMGFFLARITNSTRTPELEFRDALPTLLFLATREKYLNMDSVVEAQARKYYSKNKARYASPDTLDLQTWLTPRTRPGAYGVSLGRSIGARSDTTAFRSLRLSSLGLPDALRMRIQDSAKNYPRDSAFGPWTDKFGTWHFRIRTRRISADTLPYRLARKGILEALTAPPPPMERAKATLQGQSRFFLALGLADAYVRQKYSDKEETDPVTGRPSRPKMPPTSGFETKKPDDLVGAVRLNKAKLFSGS